VDLPGLDPVEQQDVTRRTAPVTEVTPPGRSEELTIHIAPLPGTVIRDGVVYAPAGLGPRAAAFFLDFLLLAATAQLLITAAGVPVPDPEQSLQLMRDVLPQMLGGTPSPGLMDKINEMQRQTDIVLWLKYGLCAAYFTFFHGLTGATPGKAIMGLKVLRADGSDVGLTLALGRYIGYYLSMFLIYTAWLVPFDSQRRTLYDILTRTNVFRRLPQATVDGR
jgi:uncharacterized RDD family membrane protein YckC